MLDDLNKKYPDLPEAAVTLSSWDMSLRDPLDPLFRVAQMGLGYDEDRNLVVLVAQELVADDEEAAVEPDPQIVRMWATASRCVPSVNTRGMSSSRAAPIKSNGHLIYYWT